jgi:site-specific DNA-cytosine methylase
VKAPVCIDLYCGLGGWAEGFLAEGYECIDRQDPVSALSAYRALFQAGRIGGHRMTLFDLVEEVQEKTHLGALEILDRVQRAWPSHTQFTPTQAALMVRAIQRDGQKERAAA